MTALLYLAAIVAANVAAAVLGPAVTILDAFLFVGLNMATRDRLHAAWEPHVWRRMLALIAAGGLLSWLLTASAGPIAFASTVAFLAAAVADTLTFAALGGRSQLARVNGSNVVSSALDSLIFPTLAFGSLLPLVIVGQWAAKVGGGFVWSVALNARSLALGRRAA